MAPEPRFFQIERDGFTIEALCQQMGDDYLLSIWGGEAHIGAMAMAQPRASLRDPAKRSATASVFCYVGHKEDQLVKEVSERLASALDAKVAVAAGMHWDDLTPEGVAAVTRNVDLLVEKILKAMKIDGNQTCTPVTPQPEHR
jgi:hypothetical protein